MKMWWFECDFIVVKHQHNYDADMNPETVILEVEIVSIENRKQFFVFEVELDAETPISQAHFQNFQKCIVFKIF